MKNSDAFILMQFRDAVACLRDLPSAEATAQMGTIGRPFFDQLRANGHELPDAIGLLRAVWVDIKREEK
jgi:hypothetical protein